MLELYFICYRIPKMMWKLARERQRSPVAWSLIGIGAWLGAEFFVLFSVGVSYGIVSLLTESEGEGLPKRMPMELRGVAYILALGAAIMSLLLTKRFLTSRRRPDLHTPPPPPSF